MNDIQGKLLSFFTNEKLLRVIRSILIAIVIIVLPLLYFGFKDNFSIEALIQIEVGVLVLIVALSVFLATVETKAQCFDLTCEYDDDIPTLHKTIERNSQHIREIDKVGKQSLVWLRKYNKDQQRMYDEELTNEKIEELEKRALSYRVSGKESKAVTLEKEIKKLNKKPLRDKNFEPYSIKRILNVDKNSFKFKKKKGNAEINVNPKKVNFMTQVIGTLFRSSGIGVMGTIPFAVNENIWTVLAFYLGYILIILITIVTQWILTSYVTTHSYKNGLRMIITIQEMLLKSLGYTINESNKIEEVPFSTLEESHEN